MSTIFLWATLFSITTALSILLLGHRSIVGGEIGLQRLLHILLSWQFISGAALAFCSRILFVLTNNAVHKIPEFSASSTTITTLINSAAIILVVLCNYFWLGERLSILQGVGAFLILAGIYLLTKT